MTFLQNMIGSIPQLIIVAVLIGYFIFARARQNEIYTVDEDGNRIGITATSTEVSKVPVIGVTEHPSATPTASETPRIIVFTVTHTSTPIAITGTPTIDLGMWSPTPPTSTPTTSGGYPAPPAPTSPPVYIPPTSTPIPTITPLPTSTPSPTSTPTASPTSTPTITPLPFYPIHIYLPFIQRGNPARLP